MSNKKAEHPVEDGTAKVCVCVCGWVGGGAYVGGGWPAKVKVPHSIHSNFSQKINNDCNAPATALFAM